MMIRKLDPETFDEAFGIRCGKIFPSEEFRSTPFTALWNLVPPGGASHVHRHHEGETFIVVEGAGVMTCGDESSPVDPGDVISIPPFTDHTLANRSDDERLLFLNVYWEDLRLIFERGGASPAAVEEGESRPRRVLMFGSPPNPNGDLHLGHLVGPYFSADVYKRFRRMLGDDPYYAVGTDDNQIWTAAMAEQAGENPYDLADRFAHRIEETLELADIEVDHFYRPNRSSEHARLVKDLVETLHRDGHLVARDAPALVCDACDRYLFEVYVTGTCPHCGKGCCGNACEECGRPNEVVDLVDPKCRQCGDKPRVARVRRLFFPLEPHREALEEYVATVGMNTRHRALCRSLLDAGLPEVVASHPCHWGIPVPVPGFEGQIVSAWLEMAPGYLAGSQDLADRLGLDFGWPGFWRSDDAEVVQFFGFDNCWNHALLYFAVFRAYDPEIRPPRAFVANQLYRLEGSKFSTSRNHAVWARDLIDESSADAVRFYLAYTAPESEQTSFSLPEFERFVESELAGRWTSWLRGLGDKVNEVYGGVVPEAGSWSDDHRRTLDRLRAYLADAASAYRAEGFSLRRAARTAQALVREGRELGLREDAWAGVPSAWDDRRTGVALELATARLLALVSAPLVPGFAESLWRALGEEGRAGDQLWPEVPELVTPGQRLDGLALVRPFEASRVREEERPVAAGRTA